MVKRVVIMRRVQPANRPSLTFEAYGLTMSLDFLDAEMCLKAGAALPAGARLIRDEPGYERLAVNAHGQLSTETPVREFSVGVTLGPVERLASALRQHIALHSPDLFVHAGVVAVDGAALILPGRSYSGKTTLVAALLRQGAEYLSDEYAVIDERGFILPFPKALSVRNVTGVARDVDPAALGARILPGPTPVRLIVATRFEADAPWAPQPVSHGEAMLHLLQNTVAVRSQSAMAMRRVRLACERADALAGARGEAEPAARDLLARMRAPSPGQ
jgi:hypothetical protein